MAGRYPDILVHCVFRRRNGGISCLKALLPKLWKYGAGIGRNHGIFVLAAGYFEPCSFTNCAPARHAGAKAVQVLKANSSRWLGEHEVDFSWQEGYDAFSVSSSNKHAVMITLNIRKSTIRSDPTKASLRRCCGNRELRSMRRGCSAKVPSLRDSIWSRLAFPALPCRALRCRAFGTAA